MNLLKLILPEPTESPETEVMRREDEIIQLTSPHVRPLNSVGFRMSISARVKPGGKSNATPRVAQSRLPVPRDPHRIPGTPSPGVHPRVPLSRAVTEPGSNSQPLPPRGRAAPRIPVSSAPGAAPSHCRAEQSRARRLRSSPELSTGVEVTGCLANIKPRKLKRSSRIIK